MLQTTTPALRNTPTDSYPHAYACTHTHTHVPTRILMYPHAYSCTHTHTNDTITGTYSAAIAFERLLSAPRISPHAFASKPQNSHFFVPLVLLIPCTDLYDILSSFSFYFSLPINSGINPGTLSRLFSPLPTTLRAFIYTYEVPVLISRAFHGSRPAPRVGLGGF